MKETIKKILRKLRISQSDEQILSPHGTESFSQEGEDRILARLFNQKEGPGFYVDVGAHHPQRFSNTEYFYRRGWRGINIDPTPDSMREFEKYRQRDINLEIGISTTEKQLEFYIFNEPALNTFSKETAKERAAIPGYYIEKTIEVQSAPLSKILGHHLPQNQHIDFLSIDAEGFDLEVIESLNIPKYLPDVIVTESLGVDLQNYQDSHLNRILKPHGYKLFSKAFHSLFFVMEKKYETWIRNR